jgi:hypothetical protein
MSNDSQPGDARTETEKYIHNRFLPNSHDKRDIILAQIEAQKDCQNIIL